MIRGGSRKEVTFEWSPQAREVSQGRPPGKRILGGGINKKRQPKTQRLDGLELKETSMAGTQRVTW